MKKLVLVTTGDFRRSGTFTSVKTPNYWGIIEAGGQLPINAHEHNISEYFSPTVLTYNGLRNQYASRGTYLPGTCWSAGIFTSASPTATGTAPFGVPSRGELDSLLRNRILAKVRDTPVDLGVALGEYRETADFVASAMVKTAQAYRAARKGDLSSMVQIIAGRHKGSKIFAKKAKKMNPRDVRNGTAHLHSTELKMLKVVKANTKSWKSVPLSAAGTTLALNYALKPLVSDVVGVMDIYENGLFKAQTRPLQFKTAFPMTKVNGKSEKKSGTDVFKGFRYSMEVGGRAEIRCWIDNPVTATLDKLGLLNPISTGYELVPFSFVLDWFVPIGDWLRNVPDPKGLKFVDGWLTLKMKGSWTEYTKIGSPAPGWNTELNGQQIWNQRFKLTTFPKFTLQLPDTSTYRRRITNGVSLLTTLALDNPLPKTAKPTRKDFQVLSKLGITNSDFRAAKRLFR